MRIPRRFTRPFFKKEITKPVKLPSVRPERRKKRKLHNLDALKGFSFEIKRQGIKSYKAWNSPVFKKRMPQSIETVISTRKILLPCGFLPKYRL